MPGSLTEYALRLAQTPDELARFQSSRDAAIAAMTQAGLSPHEQQLMLGGDGRRIGAALAADARASATEAMEYPVEPMEHPAEEPMEHPAEPMEHPAEEPMEYPPEAMEHPASAATVSAYRG